MARRLRLRLENRLNQLESAARETGPLQGRKYSLADDPVQLEAVIFTLIEVIGLEGLLQMVPEDAHEDLRLLVTEAEFRKEN